MNKLFLKVGAIFAGVALSIGAGVAIASHKDEFKSAEAATGTWTLSSGESDGTVVTDDCSTGVGGITFTGAQGGNGTATNVPKWYTYSSVAGGQIRVYASNDITFTIPTGTITAISFTYSGTYSNLASASTGTLSSGSWTGSASSVTFRNGSAQTRFTAVEFTYDPSGIAPDPEPEKGTTADNPFTVAEARAKIDAGTAGSTNYYVQGIYNRTTTDTSKLSQYKNADIWFSDDGTTSNEMEAFRCKYLAGADLDSTDKLPNAGDTIIVYGQLTKYNSTYELAQGCYLYSIDPGADLKDIRLQNTSHAEGPYWVKYGSEDELCLLGWDVDANNSIKSGLTWTFSSNDVVNHSEDGYTWTTLTPKAVGKVTVTLTCEGYKTVNTIVYVYDTEAIEDVYGLTKGTPVEIYGYFAGNKDGNNIILMDGDYGMDVYKNGLGTNSYVEDETTLHVIGELDIYNGLYEITNVDTVEAVSTHAGISKPVVYAAQGGETQEYASRRTTVSGVPSVSGTFPETAGSSDITLAFDLGGGKSVNVFYKKATQTADTDIFNTVKDAVANSTSITVKGFTAWYNAFQVQMNGLIEESSTYTAAAFAQELLDLTDAVCEDYDGSANNHDALVLVWNTLAGEGKYPSLPSDQKTILGSANADEDSTDVVEKAMARYDYLVAKYSLSNFIVGRNPSSGANTIRPLVNNNAALIVIVSASIVVISTVALVFVLKRKKHN